LFLRFSGLLKGFKNTEKLKLSKLFILTVFVSCALYYIVIYNSKNIMFDVILAEGPGVAHEKKL